MSSGPLVVELLTRAHRLGFVLEYLERPTPGLRVVDAPTKVTDELRTIEAAFRRHEPDVLQILARTCTFRTCTEPTAVREYGTDLPWCAGHAGARGWQLLHDEHPDLFPAEAATPHACPTWLTKETAA